jgi:methionyl-tRNA formyltransferase
VPGFACDTAKRSHSNAIPLRLLLSDNSPHGTKLMKVIIFTRTGFHHTYFINRLQEQFDVTCVIRESYPKNKKEKILRLLVKNLFQQSGFKRMRDERFLIKFSESFSAGFRYHRALKDFFKSPFDVVIEKKGTRYLDIGCGEVNNDDLASFLNDMKPDVIAVLGSSVLKPNTISIPSLTTINLHTGLSPYYRGTWSHGWPIVNGEPEYVGVTVHHVNTGIDTGDIIYQARPLLDERDDLNIIFLKVISEGIELVIRAIEQLQNTGQVTSYKQPQNKGRLYLSKDFTADKARQCLSNLEKGIIREYYAQKNMRDERLILYGCVPSRTIG